MSLFQRALQALPQAAVSPLALIAFITTVAAWLWYAYKRYQFALVYKQVNQVLKPLGQVPKAKLAETIRECLNTVTGRVLPSSIDPEQYIRSRKHQYFLIAFLSLCFLILCLAGIASYVALHVQASNRLREQIDVLQAQLQNALGKDRQLLIVAAEAHGQADVIASYNPGIPKIKELAKRLNDLVREFEAQVGSENDDLRIRHAKALIATAQRRYNEALTIVTDEDEEVADDQAIKVKLVRADAFFGLHNWREALIRYERILKLRPDRLEHPDIFSASMGGGTCLTFLGRPADALLLFNPIIGLYSRLVEQEGRKELSDSLAMALTSRGIAFYSLGKVKDAVEDYGRAIAILTRLVEQEGRNDLAGRLAVELNDRGNALTRLSKPKEAVEDYDKAIAILTRLVEQEGRNDLADQLAVLLIGRCMAIRQPGATFTNIDDYSKPITILTRLVEQEARTEFSDHLAIGLSSRGIALGSLGRNIEAIDDQDKAIAILTRLVEREGRNDLADRLAIGLSSRGIALGSLGRNNEAIEDQEKAIAILTRLIEREGRKDLASYLATSLGGRGTALSNLGKNNQAVEDYGKAIAIFARLVEREGRKDLASYLATRLSRRGTALSNLGKFKEAVEDYNKGVPIFTRLVEQEGRKELTDQLAIGLSSRGTALHGLGKFNDAVEDYSKAIAIFTRLVEQERRNDLIPQLAAVLNNRAWLWATCADGKFRDGKKAHALATQACELTGWKDPYKLNTLAAADAEAGDFDSAIKWLTKALELSAQDDKTRKGLIAQLNLYRAKKPYRE
jgi:tetratricopeptide (TPR) repeat protein